MIIGIPKEVKNGENRVAITPAGVESLVERGHSVLIEKNAGIGSGFLDDEYIELGASVLKSAEEVWASSDMILKVKEPIKSEYKFLREDLILFTYLHLANDFDLTKAIIDSKTRAIAYETVQLEDASLPLLTPMSEIAGRMAIQEASVFLESVNGGKGILVDGVPGVRPSHIVIIGSGVVGTAAIRRAIGLGARVTALDVNTDRLRYLNEVFMGRIETLYSNSYNIAQAVKDADIVVSCVLIPGAKAPKLVTEEMVKSMEKGSVLVDVAIDQGGCIETMDHSTSHDNPTFIKHDILHYAVANMPGGVPRTATLALTNATMPYIMQLANKGFVKAIKDNPALKKGLNAIDGKLVYKSVADAFNIEFTPVDNII